ncbi:MAG: transcription termination factor NusA [Candidatus Dependentiae bacterium]|nr:transcription termination factor NusA [Candidatus Dependentiae bacterium]
MNLSQVIEELVEERELDRATLSAIVCEGMLAAYKKRYPDLDLIAEYNEKADQIDILANKKVVSSVEDEDTEISLRKAKTYKPKAKLDDVITVPFEGPIGRIEILRAKQIIAQKIRSIEAAQVYEEFKPKEGAIVHGVVHKCEPSGTVVKIGETFAFLPKSLSIPGERCTVGYPMRALLKEVLVEPRNENQLILDRVSPDFLRQLFELEIPEIYERLVEIKQIVRSAGYKSKVVVSSNDKNIDPVGTCVGVGGGRIKPILRELGTEKIDIIPFSFDTEKFVKDALKPAVVNRVEINGDAAQVWVDEDQRSIAIGKMGKNISLASQLTGFQIELVREDEAQKPRSLGEAFSAVEAEEAAKEQAGGEEAVVETEFSEPAEEDHTPVEPDSSEE